MRLHLFGFLCENSWRLSVPETVLSRIDSQQCPCGSPVWPTEDRSTQHFNLSRCHWFRTGMERKTGVKFGWKVRDDTQQVNAGAPDYASTHTHTRMLLNKNTQSLPLSQSVNVHLRDSSSALSVPTDISTQLTEMYKLTTYLYSTTVGAWPHWWWLMKIKYKWYEFVSFGFQVNRPFNLDQYIQRCIHLR